MRYRLVFKKEYRVAGRYPVNMRGRIVVFQDGVAYTSDKDTADYAKKLKFIALVEGVQEKVEAPAVVVEPELGVEPVVEEAAPIVELAPEPVVEEVVEPVVEEETTGEVEVHENVVADVPETADGVLTAEEIQELYDTHGTWSAVASYLGITTTTLRKYREEAGLL